MIHNENHSEPCIVCGWTGEHEPGCLKLEHEDTMRWFQQMRQRQENPPWWDLVTRSANRTLARTRIFVDGTPREIRRFQVFLAARAVLAVAGTVGIAVATSIGWIAVPFAALAALWAIYPLTTARMYEYGFMKGAIGSRIHYGETLLTRGETPLDD